MSHFLIHFDSVSNTYSNTYFWLNFDSFLTHDMNQNWVKLSQKKKMSLIESPKFDSIWLNFGAKWIEIESKFYSFWWIFQFEIFLTQINSLGSNLRQNESKWIDSWITMFDSRKSDCFESYFDSLFWLKWVKKYFWVEKNDSAKTHIDSNCMSRKKVDSFKLISKNDSIWLTLTRLGKLYCTPDDALALITLKTIFFQKLAQTSHRWMNYHKLWIKSKYRDQPLF